METKDNITPLSLEIKVMCEVEKIWIIYDRDDNRTLDFEEVIDYLKERAYPHLSLSIEELRSIMETIDIDGNGTIDKAEMGTFLHKVLSK